MNVYTSARQLIGNTPLLRLTNIEEKEGLCAKLLAKLECFNPGGSTKDRAALAMIEDAEARGVLKPGSVIIEPTSGNTGIGLALVAALRGYRAIIVMPDTMSVERRLSMAAYGAEVVLSDGSLGMTGAIAKAEELAKDIPGSFIPGQFVNPANAKAHYETTVNSEAQLHSKLRLFWEYMEAELGKKPYKKIMKAGNLKNYLSAVSALRTL